MESIKVPSVAQAPPHGGRERINGKRLEDYSGTYLMKYVTYQDIIAFLGDKGAWMCDIVLNSLATARGVELVAPQPASAIGEPEGGYCKSCNGSGEGVGLEGGGPDAYEVPINCQTCGGTGIVDDGELTHYEGIKMDELLRVSSEDILYRLRAEERERANTIKMWRASAQAGSIRDDDHIHGLTKEAADEIQRLRYLISENAKLG